MPASLVKKVFFSYFYILEYYSRIFPERIQERETRWFYLGTETRNGYIVYLQVLVIDQGSGSLHADDCAPCESSDADEEQDQSHQRPTRDSRQTSHTIGTTACNNEERHSVRCQIIMYIFVIVVT